MKRTLAALLGTFLVAFLANFKVSAQAVGNLVTLRSSTSTEGVPVHPGPGDARYTRWPNGTVATVTARDSATGWYQVEKGGALGWVISLYMTVQRPPVITAIRDQVIPENSSTGPIKFTAADSGTPSDSLIFTATSSNHSLVPEENITFGKSGFYRAVTVLPLTQQSGSAIITVTVSDGTLTTSTKFTVTVLPAKQSLVLTVPEVTSAGTIQFLILGGNPGDTAVLEASNNLIAWVVVSTNVFPATQCAMCPSIAVGDAIADFGSRFYRAIIR